ncbi:MAG: hypothetical protein CSA72_02655 [Rhodobacterales bacterium]|nr:MAG: hypothetical protein CSA72_02655 [Rhodobacterales bacterium]
MTKRGFPMWAIGVIVTILACVPLAVHAEKYALIIANQSYENVESLENTRADARAYRDMLENFGYDTREFHLNLGQSQMLDMIDRVAERIDSGDEVVFVYSGHGWSDGAENFLVPVDAPKSGRESFLAARSVSLENQVLRSFKRAGARLTVAIIDACRNNPFTPARGSKSVGIARGLALSPGPEGSFTIFSAGRGEEALDRLPDDSADTTLSVFSRVFIPLVEAKLPLEIAMSRAQLETRDLAISYGGHAQNPAYSDETPGFTCLADRCSTQMPVADAVGGTCDQLHAAAERADRCYAWEAFVDQCPAHPLFPAGRRYVRKHCEEDVPLIVGEEEDPMYLVPVLETYSSSERPAAEGLCQRETGADAISACLSLGSMYESDQGLVRQDFEEAVKFYERACDIGIASASLDGLYGCDRAGYLLRTKIKSDERTFAVLAHGCLYRTDNVDRGQACNGAGLAADRSGDAFNVSADSIAKLFVEACEAGYPYGCGNVTSVYPLPERADFSFARVEGLLRDGCYGVNFSKNTLRDIGVQYSCKELGQFLISFGPDTTKNLEEAFAAFDRSCLNGPDRGESCEQAANYAASMIEPAPPHPFEVEKLLNMACSLDRTDACLRYLDERDREYRDDIDLIEEPVLVFDDYSAPEWMTYRKIIERLLDRQSLVFARGLPNAARFRLANTQDVLKSRGLYSGAIDGIWGPGTKRAVEAACGCRI